MTKVVIIKNWQEPDLLRQTPNSSGIWGNIYFTFDDRVKECDYVVVSNFSNKKKTVMLPEENLWCIHQEPPNEYFSPKFHLMSSVYARVFTTDYSLKGDKFVQTQPALPWHVDKSYDELKKCQIPDKPKKLSWVTSSKAVFSGHKDRIRFLNKIKKELDFDLYGRGFREIDNKWDGLASYRYCLAIENFSGSNYWSEKLADCYLAWTMPIYYGCTNIDKYFPPESFVSIDINDSQVGKKIKQAIESNLWQKNRQAIDYARNLVLEKYQLFPYLAGEINKWEKKREGKKMDPKLITLSNQDTLLINSLVKLRQLVGIYHKNL